MEADRVVVELLAKVEGFDAKVRQSAAAFDVSVGKIEAAAGRAEKQVVSSAAKITKGLEQWNHADLKKVAASIEQFARGVSSIPAAPLKRSEEGLKGVTKAAGSTRAASAEMTHVLRAATDQFAAGSPLSLIFATHISQVAQAASLAGVATGGWVIALTGAVAVLSTVLLKTRDVKDEVEAMVAELKKNAHESGVAAAAQEMFSRTTEGLNDAIRKHNELLRQASSESKTFAERALADADAQVVKAKGTIQANIALLEQAKAMLEIEKIRAQAPGQRGDIAALGLPQIARKAGFFEKQIDDQRKALATLEGIARAWSTRVAAETGERLADPVEAIKDKYKGLIEQTRIRLRNEGATTAEIQKQAKLLAQQRDAEIKAMRAREKTVRGESGREVSASEAAAIARSAGLIVNSASRTFAEQKKLYDAWVRAGKPNDNPVAPPGTSAHEGARGRWALDIQLAKGVTPDLLRKVFAAQGINLSKVFKERGHFHVEGSRSGADSEESAEDRAAQEQRRNDEAFRDKRDALDQKILALKAQQSSGIEEELKLSLAQIEAERASADRNVENDLTEGRISEAQAAELLERTGIVENLQKKKAGQAAQLANLQRQDELSQRELGWQIQDLQFLDEMASSRGQHRDLQHQIVDLVFEQRLKHLEILRAEADLAGNIQEAADIQAEINRARVEQGQAHTRVDANTRSPLEQMATDAANIDDQLEQIAANGLNDFVNGITDAITGTKSLAEAFSEMAQGIIRDLIAMIVKALIFKALQAALPGLFPAGHAEGGPVKRAVGGFIRGPGTSTSDSIPALLSDGEYVVKASAVRQLGIPFLNALNSGRLQARAFGGPVRAVSPANVRAAAPSGGGIVQHFHMTLDARHAVVTEELIRDFDQRSRSHAAAAGRAAIDASDRGFPGRLRRFQRLED